MSMENDAWLPVTGDAATLEHLEFLLEQATELVSERDEYGDDMSLVRAFRRERQAEEAVTRYRAAHPAAVQILAAHRVALHRMMTGNGEGSES